MPIDVSGNAVRRSDTAAVPNQPISSAKYNAEIGDVYSSINSPIPLSRGGTGATNALQGLTNLGGVRLIDLYTQFVSHLVDQTASIPTAQKLQARLNISAASAADITSLTAGKQNANANLTSLSGLTLVEGDLLYATGPDTLVRLPKGTSEQILAMNFGATAPSWVSPSFKRAFVSTELSVPSTVVTVAHGLGVVPSLVRLSLRCIVTQYGWAVGDEVDISGQTDASSVGANSTNITVAGDLALVDMTDKSGSPRQSSITAAAWRLVIRAYA
jgi:hypothetical protein